MISQERQRDPGLGYSNTGLAEDTKFHHWDETEGIAALQLKSRHQELIDVICWNRSGAP